MTSGAVDAFNFGLIATNALVPRSANWHVNCSRRCSFNATMNQPALLHLSSTNAAGNTSRITRMTSLYATTETAVSFHFERLLSIARFLFFKLILFIIIYREKVIICLFVLSLFDPHRSNLYNSVIPEIPELNNLQRGLARRWQKRKGETACCNGRYHFPAGNHSSPQRTWKELSSGSLIDNSLAMVPGVSSISGDAASSKRPFKHLVGSLNI